MKNIMNKNRIIIIYVLLLIVTVSVSSENLYNGDCTLFINTSPPGANVVINETLLPEATPLLLRNLSADSYTIEIRKDGFNPFLSDFNISSGETKAIQHDLESNYFKALFIDENVVIFNSNAIKDIQEGLRIFNGSYNLTRNNNILHIDPVFSKQGLMDSFNFTIPFFTLLSTVLILNDINNITNSGHLLAWPTIASCTTVSVMISIQIALDIQKKKFLRTTNAVPLIPEESSNQAKTIFDKGEKMLSSGNLEESLIYYTKVVKNYPYTIFFPFSLYKIAKIHSITGEKALAAKEYQLILDKYPIPELYDKTCQSLAVLYFIQGNYEKSLIYLNDITFIDPLFSKEEVALYGNDILQKWAKKSEKE